MTTLADALRIHDLSHGEAARLVAGGAPVFVPINPVEYHGPHLSLHNDRLISEGLAAAVHTHLAARHPDWPFLLAADLEIGVDPTPGPGTRRTPFSVARRLITESLEALAALGAQRIVLMTWHGAPLHALAMETGLARLRRRGVVAVNPFNAAFRELCRLDGAQFADALSHIADADARAAMQRELGDDFHAGFFETSLTLHYAPSSVSPLHRTLPPCPPLVPEPRVQALARAAAALGRAALADELSLIARALAWQALRPFPGYTGRPHLASAESGRVLADHIAHSYAALLEAVFAGEAPPPAPAMGWLVALTLGGRLQP